MSMLLSIIIPTCGRASLERTLRSIKNQALIPGDEVLVVTDGPQPLAKHLFRAIGLPGRCLETVVTRAYGGPQRNRAMDAAAGDYLLFMDDDDTYAPDAFAVIRDTLASAPGRPHLFRMRYAYDGRVLWKDRSLIIGNISTQMIVVPNLPGLVRWDNEAGHDYRFMVDNAPHWPPLVWREEVIAIIRPRAADLANLSGPTQNSPPPPRRVEDCPFRELPPGVAEADTAHCLVLRHMSGVEDLRLCEVGRDACVACCASIPPSSFDLNPVVASLLFDLADQVIQKGGVTGCSLPQAEGALRWAEVNLSSVGAQRESDSTPKRVARDCCFLGEEIGSRPEEHSSGAATVPVYACRHPAREETTLQECHWCRDWSERPDREIVPLARLVPPPLVRHGQRVGRWSVAVTTAPRRRPTIDWCLDSVIRAGWESPRIIMDSRVAVDQRFAKLPITLRETRVGAWPSYYLTMVELLMREPRADALLLVQDDVLLFDRENLREYLERILWPADKVGAVSLFCSNSYKRAQPGWQGLDVPWFWGAQAFIFPRESAKLFVADPLVLEHRWSHWNRGLTNIDVVIGKWSERHGLPVWYPSPSLAEHIGDTSTLWATARIEGSRKAGQFAGDMG